MNPQGRPPSTPPGAVPTVAWRSDSPAGLPGVLELCDQTLLPEIQKARVCRTVEEARTAIRELCVRGAPAIGVAAAYAMVLGAQEGREGSIADLRRTLTDADHRLRTSRPTAVNLAWALDRAGRAVAGIDEPREVVARLLAEARAIHEQDEESCAAMGRHGLSLVRDGGSYLTHCNTGRLAAAGIGTAFGVFVTAAHTGLDVEVYAGEVRPLLQGARLTAFEIRERGLRGRLLPDSAAGALLASGRIEGVFVGADRIAANGDTANKIGTYALAELARANGVPFHVVAPVSTVDPSLSDGSLIPIEERDGAEVLGFRDLRWAPEDFPVFNPAFDVTPAHLISSFVTERGIARPPFRA